MNDKFALITIGTRPEITRFKTIIEELDSISHAEILHTGQHYSENMSENFFKQLGLKDPIANLGVQEESPPVQLAKIIEKSAEALEKIRPSIVCVYGDTASSLAVALAANKLKIKLCHVEAGCRSFDFRMPEEYNRVLIDHMADVLIAVSNTDHKQLLKDRVFGKIHQLGDPSYDLFLQNIKRVNGSIIRPKYNLHRDKYIFATIHRAENVDNEETLKNILLIFKSIPEYKVFFAIHPRTRKLIDRFGLQYYLGENMILSEPVGYLESIELQLGAEVVITDSGGLQKEAFFAQTPCITLRKTTEHTDTTDLKANFLIDPEDPGCFIQVKKVIDDLPKIRKRLINLEQKPYGIGRAAIDIAHCIKSYIL